MSYRHRIRALEQRRGAGDLRAAYARWVRDAELPDSPELRARVLGIVRAIAAGRALFGTAAAQDELAEVERAIDGDPDAMAAMAARVRARAARIRATVYPLPERPDNDAP